MQKKNYEHGTKDPWIRQVIYVRRVGLFLFATVISSFYDISPFTAAFLVNRILKVTR